MATLQKIGERYYCKFMYGGVRRTFTIGPVSGNEARQWQSRTDTLLMRIKQGLLKPPDDPNQIADFLLHDGKLHESTAPAKKHITLSQLREGYLAAVGNGVIEKNTLYTAKIHFDHLEKTYGGSFVLAGLTLGRLQDHITRRSKDVSIQRVTRKKAASGKLSRKRIAAITIKKELDTFRSAWNWALRMKLVEHPFPSSGLLYPKTDEKLPFMTWHEIERRIKAGGDASALWGCLFLDTTQIADLLVYVKAKAAPAWVFPMVAIAAHTGARRSEMIRARCEDVDLENRIITIREKKRAKGVRTTRRVPISATLLDALKDQLQRQQGKPYLFGPGDRPLSTQSTQKALWRVLRKSKWEVVKGWHVCRHSFVSALASKGIDQRIIDDFVGHQTESQRQRYRHLYPNVTTQALTSVFG